VRTIAKQMPGGEPLCNVGLSSKFCHVLQSCCLGKTWDGGEVGEKVNTKVADGVFDYFCKSNVARREGGRGGRGGEARVSEAFDKTGC